MQPSILDACCHAPLCDLPAASDGQPSYGRIFDLAPDGVCNAANVAVCAVSSCLAISPLPLAGRYIFCCTFHRLTAPGCCPATCPVVFGLSSLSAKANKRGCLFPSCYKTLNTYIKKKNSIF